MAKQCSFCGKSFGIFSTGYDIPNSNYSYCDSHLNYKILIRNALLEDIDADLSPIINSFGASLKTKTAIFPEALSAMIASLRNELTTDAEQQARKIDEARKEAERLVEQQKLAEEKQREIIHAANTMMLTTGYSFEGYKIVKYCDVLFDELIIGMGLFKSIAASFDNLGAAIAGTEANVMSSKLSEVKSTLRDRVKVKAAELGANALIGIDFESSSVGDLMMVSMTATAVILEREE